MAIGFNASGDYAKRTGAPAFTMTGNTDKFTMAGWMKIRDITPGAFSYPFGVEDADASATNFALIGITDLDDQEFAVASVAPNWTTPPSQGVWYYFYITGANNASDEIDFNAGYYTAAGSSPVDTLNPTLQAEFNVARISIGADSWNEWLDCALAYVRVWTGVILTDAELRAERDSPTAVKTSGLWADWPLINNADTGDNSGNNRTLTFGGTLTNESGPLPDTVIYHVRKSGSDSNVGTSPSEAWLTIDKAANTVVPGDTVYIGAGVYRELVTLDTPGSSGLPIKWIGDIDGSQTGDPGLVIIEGRNSDSGAAVRANCLTTASAGTGIYNEFYYIQFAIATGTVVHINGPDKVVFYGCTFYKEGAEGAVCLHLWWDSGTGDKTNLGFTVDSCFINGQTIIETGSWDAPASNGNPGNVIRNCVFRRIGTASYPVYMALNFYKIGTGTYINNQTKIENNLFISRGGVNTGNWATADIAIIRNCIFLGMDFALWSNYSSDTGGIDSDYNIFYACQTEYTRVTQGSNDYIDTRVPFYLYGLISSDKFNNITRNYFYKQMLMPFTGVSGTEYFISSLYNVGNYQYGGSLDILKRPRYGNTSLPTSAGPTQPGYPGELSSAQANTGTYSIAMKEYGHQEIFIPVDATSTTVTVYGRYDSNYGTSGPKPTLKVIDIPGVADQSDVMTGAANQWEQLSVNFTPTSAGTARILLMCAGESTSNIYFDDLEVS